MMVKFKKNQKKNHYVDKGWMFQLMVLFLPLVSIFLTQFNFHQGVGEGESGIINLLDQQIWGNLQ